MPLTDKKKNVDKIMAAAYLERANQVKGLTDVAQFVTSYPDVGRVFKYLNYDKAGQAAQRVFDLYKRHSNEVMGRWMICSVATARRFVNARFPVIACFGRPMSPAR